MVRRIIINGGDPLPGCPESTADAQDWEQNANKGKEYGEPKWAWDCGFKLDFDGPLVDISSRFYPPKTHYGAGWDGTVKVRVLGKTVAEEKFVESSLDELRAAVEAYARKQASTLLSAH